MILQDKYLPEFDVRSTHEINIEAGYEYTFELVENLDFSQSKIIAFLFRLRGLPVPEAMTIQGIQRLHFKVLERKPNQGFILGLVGQFWTPFGNLQDFDTEKFNATEQEEFAKATWSFEVIPKGPGQTLVKTETRVRCPNDEIRKKFKRYWFFVGPFSGVTRKEMLKAIKNKAESNK